MHPKTNTSQDYYPFGMLMPTRTWDAESSYRFGFNTQERIDEISGKGNHNTALFWEYDTRLGRRWNLDPKPNAAMSSYACLGNNPIMFNDLLGDTVGYNSFKERVDVFIAKALSKNFKKEFKHLKKSNNLYVFNKLPQLPDNSPIKELGDVQKTGQQAISSGNGISEKFSINYRKSNPRNNDGIGRSPYHALFEETFHAADYDQRRGTSDLTAPDQNGNVFVGHAHGDRSHEARAWVFAANNAPFTPKTARMIVDGEMLNVNNPLIQQIKAKNTTPDGLLNEVENLLYNGYTLEYTSPATFERNYAKDGKSVMKPLYE